MDEGRDTLVEGFSEKSIRVTASRLGIEDLSSSVCRHISKEAFYKTNKLIYTAKKIMSRNKSSILTTDDIQKAISLLGDVQIYGHDNNEPSNFIRDPIENVYRESDYEVNLVNLALEGKTTKNQFVQPQIQGNWILPDDSSQNPKCDPYYEELAKTILSGNPHLVQVALQDLRTNSKIGPASQFFLNFIASSLGKTNDISLINNLLDAVYALAVNRYIDPNPYHAVNNIVEAVLSVAIRTKDPTDSTDWSDLPIRTKAGLLIEKLLLIWTIERKQRYKTVTTLAFCLKETGRPCQSHYGAVLALTALAPSLPAEALQIYWREIENYFTLMASAPDTIRTDDNLKHLMAAISVAWRNECKVQELLYTIFGDSVIPFRIPWTVTKMMPKATPKTHTRPPKLKLKMCSPLRPHWYVHRNLKHCRPSHTRSAVGDISLTL